MALIQTFEIVFELGWKILKDYLKKNGIITNFPKKTIKEAFSTETITAGQIWIDMLETRNSTSYEYNMDKVDRMLEDVAYRYFDELNNFHIRINDSNFNEEKHD